MTQTAPCLYVVAGRYVASPRLGPNLKSNQFPASCISLDILLRGRVTGGRSRGASDLFETALPQDIGSQNAALTQTEEHLMGSASGGKRGQQEED